MHFSFDVTVSSHDLLRRGVCEARLPASPHHHHRVVIAGDDPAEASLAAAQMAACIPGALVTGVYLRV